MSEHRRARERFRFWTYANGSHVLVTLSRERPRLHWWTAQRHEEGWTREDEAWELDGCWILSHRSIDGTDCDGRLYEEWSARAHVAHLRDHWCGTCADCGGPRTWDRGDNWGGCIRCGSLDAIPDAPAWFPRWERVSQARRDYRAEANGY